MVILILASLVGSVAGAGLGGMHSPVAAVLGFVLGGAAGIVLAAILLQAAKPRAGVRPAAAGMVPAARSEREPEEPTPVA